MELAFALLVAALGLFWLSTRQFPLIARGAIWIAASALLVWIATATASQRELGIWSAIGDAWGEHANFRETAIYRALSLNLETIAPFLLQMFDFFVVATAVLGALSLIAFGPGEALERFVRPSILIAFGFIAGSVATLAIVAIGFGGYSKPRTFTSDGQQVRAHDGDTFWIGEHSLRLYGVDAPESEQRCLGLVDENCGEAARVYLASFVARGTLQCDQMLSRRSERPRDSFGRALVRCWLTDRSGERVDLGEELVRTGFAVQYEGDAYGYENAETTAQQSSAGLLSGCWLRPDIQRSRQAAHGAAREALAQRQRPAADIPTVGNCSVLQ